MYAGCGFTVGSAADVTAITGFADAWVSAPVALWLVAAGTLRSGVQLARG